jgi:hypothetical protein
MEQGAGVDDKRLMISLLGMTRGDSPLAAMPGIPCMSLSGPVVTCTRIRPCQLQIELEMEEDELVLCMERTTGDIITYTIALQLEV